MKGAKEVEILWTGGFDSTFRICQLSRRDVVIQPYYLSDQRESEAFELRAISTITKKLKGNAKTKASFRNLIVLSTNERKENSDISAAYRRLLQADYMGSQYEWLAIFAIDHPGIEMSIHKDDKAMLLIGKHGVLEKTSEESKGSYFFLNRRKSELDCVRVFGNFHFPLANYTKLEMKAEYERMGLSDIINDTWFCFTPKNGKPCGCCNACKYAIEEGMAFRFPKSSLRRYKWRQTRLFLMLRRIKHSFIK